MSKTFETRQIERYLAVQEARLRELDTRLREQSCKYCPEHLEQKDAAVRREAVAQRALENREADLEAITASRDELRQELKGKDKGLGYAEERIAELCGRLNAATARTGSRRGKVREARLAELERELATLTAKLEAFKGCQVIRWETGRNGLRQGVLVQEGTE